MRVGKATHDIEDDELRLWYIQSRLEEPRLLEDLNELVYDIVATHSEGKFVLSKEPPDPTNLLSAPEAVPPPWDNAYDDVVAANDAICTENDSSNNNREYTNVGSAQDATWDNVYDDALAESDALYQELEEEVQPKSASKNPFV